MKKNLFALPLFLFLIMFSFSFSGNAQVALQNSAQKPVHEIAADQTKATTSNPEQALTATDFLSQNLALSAVSDPRALGVTGGINTPVPKPEATPKPIPSPIAATNPGPVPQKFATIVMLGDSITMQENWGKDTGRGATIINKGIAGQTTAQMLARLDEVIKLRPKAVFIMGGINDLALGNIYLETTFHNLRIMAERLRAAGIEPVFQSTLYVSKPQYVQYNLHVTTLNLWLKVYAKAKGITFIDLNSVLSKNERLIAAYTVDGVHLNKTGYQLWIKKLVPILRKFD
jgi:lysophospholipase L1-like esterase